MFVRFVVLERHPQSHCAMGVFQALYALRDRDNLRDDEADWFAEAARWFNAHLCAPRRLSRATRAAANHDAVCWFRHKAREHIARVRDLTALLEHRGVPTRMLVTRRPGYVVYRDAHQVAAVPFRDAAARRIN